VKNRILSVVVVALAVAAAAPALASDFMDTWITFAFSDDNLLANARDRSPNAGFHYTGNEVFFDNFNRSTMGYETLAHLVLYKAIDSYFKNLTLEAALVIQLENATDEITWETETRLRDDGSYIKLNFLIPPKQNEHDVVALTLFPIDSDRFRLGYAYDLSWGGNQTWPANTNPAPGVKLRYDFGTDPNGRFGGYAFGGAKAVRLLREDINEVETFYGALAGFGFDWRRMIGWEVNGGYFQKGVFPPQSYDSSIGGKPMEAHGASTRLTFHYGMPIGESVDFRLYRRDLETVRQALEKEEYGPGVSTRASVEFTYREQTMLDWEQPDTTVYQPAMAGAFQWKLKYDYFRVFADVVYRQLSYVLFDVPGLAPYYDYPPDATITDEIWGDVGFDYHFASAHVTLGLRGGYKRPATYQGPTDIPDAVDEQSVIVVRDEGDLEILPPGETAFDIISVKPNLRVDLADGFSLLSEIQYMLDKNRTKYVETEDGAKRVFEDDNVTNILGFSLLMQARF
jgi:hypothetical protein